MNCKNCSHEMYHPGGDAIEWACSWCGHMEWFAEWVAKHPRQPTKRAADGAKAGSEKTVVAKFKNGKLVSERVISPRR